MGREVSLLSSKEIIKTVLIVLSALLAAVQVLNEAVATNVKTG